ncbi:transmembrane protein 174 [Python bivittatus]|uniref:Transmembrane protein 174 n=1 Tax=Python bivittatus TaxID=176946 RepID=A0A9F2QXY4_PYTBI|nr:transmembrane protein 174 [Python bivittatus]
MEHNHITVEDTSTSGLSVSPCQPDSSEIPVSDDDKTGAALLFSGVFLGVVGITFTVMGWVKYEGVVHFVWTRLLGPTLLSVGVAFLLIAVCKFKILTCNSCNQSEERAPDAERTHNGLYAGISQPIAFQGAAVVPHLPSSPTQEGVEANLHQALNRSEFPLGSTSIIPVLIPPHSDNVSPMDSSAFSVENYSAYLTVDTTSERSTNSLEEPEEILDEDLCSDSLPPPYEKLFPPLP